MAVKTILDSAMHAKLVVYGLPAMTKPQVKGLCKWLRKHADEIENEQDLNVYRKNLFIMRLMK